MVAIPVALPFPTRFKGGIQCTPVDADGSALTSSSLDDTSLLMTCIYGNANHCIYFFADESLSSGPSICPVNLARDASALNSRALSISSSNAAARDSISPDIPCPSVDNNGTALTASSPYKDPDEAGDFVSCTYPAARFCTYFTADGEFHSGSSICPSSIDVGGGSLSTVPKSTSASISPSSTLSAGAASSSITPDIPCPSVDNNGTALTASGPFKDPTESGDFVSCTYPAARDCTYFSADGEFHSGSSICPSNIDVGGGSSSTAPKSTATSQLSTSATSMSPSNSSSPSSASSAGAVGRDRVNVGAIAGGAIAGVIVLLVIGLGLYRCRRGRGRETNAKKPEEMSFLSPTPSVPRPYPITASSFTRSLSTGKARMDSPLSPDAQLTHRSESTVDDDRTTRTLSPSAPDPAILQALESLRNEVREVRWLATEGMQPPPGYAPE
ncbi:hypothetical protein B0H19DRAFT_1377859 [Mycena capillaripes]|nr:hypothetical protein B0H19DRAFT_1377859 [Mycena capillaripes]